jgi:hypothetical protein
MLPGEAPGGLAVPRQVNNPSPALARAQRRNSSSISCRGRPAIRSPTTTSPWRSQPALAIRLITFLFVLAAVVSMLPRKFAADSPVEGDGFELVWGFPCQVVFFGLLPVLCSEREGAVLHPVAYDQVPGARGRGQGSETLAKLGGLPPSGACVWQRLDA